MRASDLAILVPAAVLGLVIWHTYPGLAGVDRPYDDKEFWFCVIATSALGGALSPRRGWLTGLAITVPQFLYLLVDLAQLGSPHAWRGVAVYLVFVALCACTADLATTLRRIGQRLLGTPEPVGVYAAELH